MPEPPKREKPQTAVGLPHAAPPAPKPPPPATAPSAADLEAPGFRDLAEASLQAPIFPGSVFESMAARQAPSYGSMLWNVVLWSLTATLLEFALKVLQLPGGPGAWSMTLLAVSVPAVVLLSAAGSFAAAGVLHVLALLSGGGGAFGRSYQAVSLMSAMLPAAALASQLHMPSATALPVLYAVYMGLRAVGVFHAAPLLQASLVVGTFGLMVGVASWTVARRAAEMRAALAPWAGLATLAAPPVGSGAPPSPVTTAAGAAAPAAGTSGLDLLAQPGQAALPSGSQGASAGGSSLDMVMPSPGGGAAGAPAGNAMPFSQEQMRQMQAMGASALKSVQQMGSDPALRANMDPEQAKQMEALMGLTNMLTNLHDKRSAGGKGSTLTDAEVRKMMQGVSGLMQSIPMVEPAPRSPRRRSRSSAPVPAP